MVALAPVAVSLSLPAVPAINPTTRAGLETLPAASVAVAVTLDTTLVGVPGVRVNDQAPLTPAVTAPSGTAVPLESTTVEPASAVPETV